jgi:antitoxin (DNA-binding transcriptional repressor) of toxin-antitoxin stability system
MEHRISATELARRLGDVLGKIRYLGDSFVIEKSGDPVARIGPLAETSTVSLREAIDAWLQAGARDPELADALERVGSMDRAPGNPWGS